MTKSKRPVGRPKGAIQTPATMLLTEMRESTTLLRKTRKIISEQLDMAETELKTLKLVDKLDLLTKLAQIAAVLNKSLEGASKYIQSAPKIVEETEHDIMEEILGTK